MCILYHPSVHSHSHFVTASVYLNLVLLQPVPPFFSLPRFPVPSMLLPNLRAVYLTCQTFSKFLFQVCFTNTLLSSLLVKVQVYDSISRLVCSWSKQVLKVKDDDLIPANPDILDGVDDLMQLSYLNEPSVLYNLQYRYDRDLIYVCTDLPN